MDVKATSLTGNDLKDWLIQRATAVTILTYVLCISGFVFKHPNMSYTTWVGFFMQDWIKAFSFIAILSVLLHGWIGIWMIITDYIKCSCIRLAMQGLVALTLLGVFAFGIIILWGI